MTDRLQQLRNRLDELDHDLLGRLKQRQELVRDLTLYKQEQGLPLRDMLRESSRIEQVLLWAQELGLDPHLVKHLAQRVLEYSGRYAESLLTHGEELARHRVVVSYQGTGGAYSEMAAEQHFGPRQVALETRGYESFEATLQAVANGEADYGMLPVENTTSGSITDAYDLLAETDLVVVGEEVFRVQHCLVGLPGARLDQVRHVFSHPQGLLQCSRFIAQQPGCKAEAFVDTAMSVVKVRDEADPSQAAVASERAAERYGLEILARDIANQKNNFTRFMVVARSPIQYDSRIACKSSLIFATAHSEGALLRCLSALSARHLNLTKLESRPRPGKPFEYLFYLDFAGNMADEHVRAAVAELKQHTKFFKVLGSYPARAVPRAAASTERGANAFAVSVGPHSLGSGPPLLLAGPRVVRDRSELQGFARLARDGGAVVLRAPSFSAPRSAGDCTGPGEDGLPWLTEVAHRHDLQLASNPVGVPQVQRLAGQVSLLELLGSQVHDFGLLERVGRVDCPVLLHRDPLSTDEDYLAVVQRVRKGGNQQVVLCQPVPAALVTAPDAEALQALVAGLRRAEAAPLCFAVTVGAEPPVQFAELINACLQAGADGLVLEVDLAPGQSASPRLFQVATEAFAMA